MSRVPGRATSLATIGALVLLSGLALLGSVLSASSVAHPYEHHPKSAIALQKPSTIVLRSKPGPYSSDASSIVGTAMTRRFKCAGSPVDRPELTYKFGDLPPLVATTLCVGSSWYVSEHLGTLVAKPFRIPYDPPIPASVVVERFVPVERSSLPAVMVRLENFGDATLYELYTISEGKVSPVTLVPGASPMLLLRSSTLLQGAGFTCSSSPAGEVIHQYEWYVINPTILKTSSAGKVLDDPGVFLQSTIYSAASSTSYSSSTLSIVQVGYDQVEPYVHDSC